MTRGRPAVLAVEAPLDADGPLREALAEAEKAGIEWLSLLSPGETMADDALELALPAMPSFDAVFGAIEIAGALWRPSRIAFDEPWRLPHALLHWWVGPPRFMRTRVLRRLIETGPKSETATDRLFRTWDGMRCIKLAAVLAKASAEPASPSDETRAGILDRLASDPVLLPVPYGERVFRLPYTGRNAGIEREQTRGLFFEAGELEFLKARLGAGGRVVDVGANTGNHTVFFAGPMRAESVLPFEPLPDAALALRRAVRANGLACVDLSMLCRGVGAAPGRMRAERSERGGLGATRLVPDASGEIEVVRLDDVLAQPPTFLKIDVEGMEMDVLAGAAATIAKARPSIFIEIAHANTGSFLDWLELAKYRIERIFSDKGHANYLILPEI